MSEDIYYHAFSPTKADKEWVQAKKDMKVITEKIKEVTPNDYESPKAREKKFLQMRKEHDAYLEKLGKPLLRALVEQGKDEGIKDYRDVVKLVEVVPDNSDQYNVADARYRPAQLAERITISSGNTKDEDEYLKTFLRFRDEEDKAKYDTDVPEPESGALNKRQQEILSKLWDVFYSPEVTKKQLLHELVALDLFLGATTVEIEETRLEYDIIEALMLYMDMETDDNLPTRKEWIRLIKEKDIEALQKTVEAIQDGIGQVHARSVLHDYLRNILPVVKKLNENNDAIFVRVVEGSNIRPASAQKMLLYRAQLHYQEIMNNKIS